MFLINILYKLMMIIIIFSARPLFLNSKMAKLEELEEVDLSGNMLKTVPTTIMNCRRMHTLIAHSNSIEVFPEVMQLMEMKVREQKQHMCSSLSLIFLLQYVLHEPLGAYICGSVFSV